jgi:hypothetical protein
MHSCRICLKPTHLTRLKAILEHGGELGIKIFLVTGVQVNRVKSSKRTLLILIIILDRRYAQF